VSRPAVSVRPVSPSLHPEFTGLWLAARVEAGSSPESASRAVSEGRVAAALAREDVRAYLAFVDGEAVGYMVLTHSPLSGLTDSPCVSIDQLYVAESARRQGAARALLTAAATYAERFGADQVATCVPAQGRDANRFFARLGFSSYVVKRVTTTVSLRRKLAGEDVRRGHDQVLQRRRSLRARATRADRQLIGG
jgi:GNAT superfamily N-acetyltransferase